MRSLNAFTIHRVGIWSGDELRPHFRNKEYGGITNRGILRKGVHMDSRYFIKMIFMFTVLLAFLSGCPARVWVSKEPPVPLGPFMNSNWGNSVIEVKKAIEKDGNQWFKDSTDQSPYALYASGNYWDYPAIFTYFFTPKSKRLYRVDVTYSDLKVYEKNKNALIQKYKMPSYSQPDVDHWSWDNKSLLILQRDATHVQLSYASGPLLIQNQEEGGSLRK